MGQFRNSQSVNDDTFIRLGLKNKSNLVQPDVNTFVLNAYQQYETEKNLSTKYRVNGKLRIITDNSIAGAWNTTPEDKDWDPTKKDDNNTTRNWIIQVTYPSELDEEFILKSVNDEYINTPIPSNEVKTKAYDGVQLRRISDFIGGDGIQRVKIKTHQKHGLSPNEYIYLKPTENTGVLDYLGFHRVLMLDPEDEETGLILETDFVGTIGNYEGTVKRVFEPSLDDFNFYKPNSVQEIQACDENGNLVGPLTHTKIRTQNHDLQVNDFVDIRFNASSSLNGVWRVVSVPSLNDFVVRYQIPNGTGNVINITGNSSITNQPLTLNYRKLDGVASEYYVRKFEVLTEVKDYEIYRGAYEKTIFTDDYSNGSYLFHFNKDVDIDGLRDNLGRPLTELYVTITRRSSHGGSNEDYYRGWSDVTSFFENNKHVVTVQGINENLALETLSFWQNGDPNSSGTIQYPSIGNKLIGDFVEFNRAQLLERKLSDIIYRFTPTELDPNSTPNNATYITNREAYYYYPHNRVEIRKFSEAIETSPQKENEIYPDYVISDNNGNFVWRDVLDIGVFQPNGNGIDYPFVNGAHYLFQNYSIYIRKQLPTGATDFSVNKNEFKNPGNQISGEKC